MSGKEYGVGIVGCGNIFCTHAEAVQQIPEARLVAVCDANETAARGAAQKYGCDYVLDYGELVARSDVDVVDVLTYSGTHAEVGIAAAEAGKHVIVTKPIEVTLETIDRLIATCDRNGVVLAATHQFRSYPPYVETRRAVQEGWLGRLVLVMATLKWHRSQRYYDSAEWRGTYALDGGGALMNQAVHYVDLVRWIGGEVAAVCGHTATRTHHIEVEDVASASLRFVNGALGVLVASTSVYGGLPATLEVYGERGNIVVQGDVITNWQVEGHEPPPPQRPHATGSADPLVGLAEMVQAHVIQISDALAAIREGRPPVISGREARKSVEIILAVYESARAGKTVNLPVQDSPQVTR